MYLTGEHPLAIDSALACLRRFGIDLPAHPTLEQVRAEYETVWQTLGGRTIESLIDLPLMTDPEMQAAMQVLSVLAGPATFTDFQLFCLLACRMVNISMQHGMSGASALRLCLPWVYPWPGLSPLPRRLPLRPGLPATWSRSTASPPTTRRSTMRWD